MNEIVNITTIEDDSVSKKTQRTASKLYKKYTKKRDINETKIRKFQTFKSKFAHIMLISALVLLTIIAGIFCLSTTICKFNRTPPTFAGYSFMRVLTGSMTSETIEIDGVSYDSGHNAGDNIVIRSVDTDTLKVGDKIAFVVYAESFNEYYKTSPQKISSGLSEVKYKTSIKKFFGFQSNEVYTACKSGSKIVFHHIVDIYEHEGVRWFKTQGSSVEIEDYWVIKENFVLGIYDSSNMGKVITSILNFLTNKWGFVLTILMPIISVGLLCLYDTLRNLYYAKLEYDVVEEKRKITDDVCRRAQIGYRMNNKTKLKVLAQASIENKQEYINLLWKDGKAPNKIKKYYIEKRILLEPIQQLLEVNKTCEQMLKNGTKPEKIAKYYMAEKAKITKNEVRIKSKIKSIKKKYAMERKSV